LCYNSIGMKKHIIQAFVFVVITSTIFGNRLFAQKISKDFNLQLKELIADHQLKFPNLTKKVYTDRENHLLWFDNEKKLVWKAQSLLYNSGQNGLNPNEFHCDKITTGLLSDLLLIKGSNEYKTTADILLTDGLINFIYQIHYGKANPNFPLKKLDNEPYSGLKADNILLQAIKKENFEEEIFKVQPNFESYKQLQQYLKLMVGQYTGDCYESSEETEKLMAVNLERWRWFNSVETPYLLVNIPSFEVQYRNGSEKKIFNAIVGSPKTPTPLIISTVKTIKTSPEWDIHESFIIEEILLEAVKKPAYIYQNHFIIYNDNEKVFEPTINNLKLIQKDVSKYHIIKKAGYKKQNSIVLNIDNKNKISIQNSPVKGLFKNTDKALSKGSIIIENPDSLIDLLLKQDNQSARTTNEKGRKLMTLKHPIPIFIGYFTCVVRDGILNTYKDIYHYDEDLKINLGLK
jgi:murein L,D-transpeptidase YcbB/YkuD